MFQTEDLYYINEEVAAAAAAATAASAGGKKISVKQEHEKTDFYSDFIQG